MKDFFQVVDSNIIDSTNLIPFSTIATDTILTEQKQDSADSSIFQCDEIKENKQKDSSHTKPITTATLSVTKNNDTLLRDEPLYPLMPHDSNLIFSNVFISTLPQKKDTFITFLQPQTKPLLDIHPRTVSHSEWITGLLLFIFILFAWIKYYYKQPEKQIFQAFVHKKFSKQLFKEQQLLSNNIMFFLFFIYLVILTLFLFIIFKGEGIDSFLLMFSMLILGYSCKMFINWLIGLFFQTSNASFEYFEIILIFNNILGVLLFPLIISIVFLSIISYKFFILLGIIGMLLFFILRIWRGINIGVSHKFSYFHIFLYFCILEILPLIILTKVLIGKY